MANQAKKEDECTGHFWESGYRLLNGQAGSFGLRSFALVYGLSRSESYSSQSMQHV